MADGKLNTKIKLLVFLLCVTAPISILASLLLLTTLHRAPQLSKHSWTTYHRLFISISIADVLYSSAAAFGPFPIVAETGYFGAHGSTGTCTAQAFFQTLGVSTYAYGSMLMIYYVSVIRFNLSNQFIEKRLELILHAMPALFYFGISLAGLALDVFNPAGPFSCWLGTWPPGCDRDPTVDCTRGGTNGEISAFFREYLLVAPILAWTFLSLFILLVVGVTVVRRYRHGRRFVFRGDTNISSDDIQGNRTSNAATKTQRQVIVQCILYGILFTNSLLWRSLRTFFDWTDKPYDAFNKHFWVTFLGFFFFPLQGLWNFVVFIRPRYLVVRSQHSHQSRWCALKLSIWCPLNTSREGGEAPAVLSSSASRTGSNPMWRHGSHQEGNSSIDEIRNKKDDTRGDKFDVESEHAPVAILDQQGERTSSTLVDSR